jgi:hypothetical protein
VQKLLFEELLVLTKLAWERAKDKLQPRTSDSPSRTLTVALTVQRGLWDHNTGVQSQLFYSPPGDLRAGFLLHKTGIMAIIASIKG